MPRSALAPLLVVLVLAHAAEAADPAPADKMSDVRPPIGVVAGMVFEKGTVTLSYRYERDDLDGLMKGGGGVPPLAVALAYPVVPTSQTISANVVELTWTPFTEVTLLFSLPYLIKDMEQIGPNGSYGTGSDGFGDLAVLVLYRIFEDRRSRTHLTLGLTFPTGSIDQTGLEPGSPGELVRLPYSMQLGSGTVDLQVGFTYNGNWRGAYWGGQVLSTLRSGTNANGYKVGNRYGVTGWGGYRWLSWVSTSFRLDWTQWFNISGWDPLLDPTVSVANDPNKQAGRRLDALFGLDFYIDEGRLSGTRLSVEAGLPAYQNLDGPQLATDWLVSAGFRHVF